MTVKEILALLEANQNARGIENWKKEGIPNVSSYGLGVTQIKALAKKMGKKNHALALELWATPNYECKILATLLDNPKEVTREQVDAQLKELGFWMFSYSYCSNLLSGVSFKLDLIKEWATDKAEIKRRCAYLLLYGYAYKSEEKETAAANGFFDSYLEVIERDLQQEENFVKDAMNNCLFAIGQLNKTLHQRCIDIATKIGKVVVDYGDNSCQAVDVLKHLNNERNMKKFAS